MKPDSAHGAPRELVVARRGRRLGGWFLDALVFFACSIVLDVAGVSVWPRYLTLQVLETLNAVVLVAVAGGNLGNLAVGTRVVVAGDGSRPGYGRTSIRWIVIAVPLDAFGLAGLPRAAWLCGVVVYGPILFTTLRQGLHDLATASWW